MMKVCPIVAFFLLASAAVPSAMAQSAPPAQADSNERKVVRLTEEAIGLYNSHDYRKAIEKFLEAYAVDSDPNYLYNIARSYEALGDRPAAIEKYEEFLSKPGGDIGGRKKAEEALKRLRSPNTAESTPPPSPSTEPSSGSTVSLSASPAPEPGSDAPDRFSDMQIAGMVVGGVGILGLGVGSAFGLVAKSKNDDASAYCSGDVCTDERGIGLTEDARSAANVSTFTFVSGGLLVVAGSLLFLFGPEQNKNASAVVRVVPEVAPKTAGLSLAGVWQ